MPPAALPCSGTGKEKPSCAYLFHEVSGMEKRGQNMLSAVAELFDLPGDVVAGLPRLEMVGSRQLYVEHHTGILAYSDTCIDANTTAGLLAMTAEELRVGGCIHGLEWVRL